MLSLARASSQTKSAVNKVIHLVPKIPWLIFTVVLCQVLVSTLSAGETLDVRGVKIHFIVEGKGEPVVLIHGLYSSAAVNWQMPGIISMLSKDYQVIALDMPGHGESDKPESPDAYGLQMVEDVVQLLDHLKVKKAHIVGYSMGGMVTVKFISKHQDRVLSGIVGGMGWLREGSRLQRFWEQSPAREGSRTPGACVRGLGRLAVTKEELQAIRVPVVILVGDRDPTNRLYVTPLRQVRSDWESIEIEGAGHLNCVVKPQFKEEMKRWLDGHRGH